MSTKSTGEISKCVRISADDVFLLGDLQLPEESSAVIVFAHDCGRSQNNPRNRHVARLIREKGLGTLMCDLLTEDEEAEDEVNETYRHNADFLAKRLSAVTQWVIDAPDTQNLRIGYFGICAGGAAVLIAAAELADKVGAVVSRGGRLDLATQSVPHVTCPTLLIVGEHDTVGIELNREALPNLDCKKELHVVAGASHLFGEPGKLETMAQLSAEWFNRHLVVADSHA
jgi:dienelactone hydrolase